MALEDFRFLARLGSGVFSSVYKAKRLIDDKNYAIKKVKLAGLTQKQKQNALNEAIILASLNHPNIIGYHESIIDQESQSLCIVMQYASQGDLLQKIMKKKQSKEQFQEVFIWKVMISVLNGLKHLHSKKIVHRDLKSANIFIGQKDSIKIGDMNVSKVTKQGLCFTQTGTPYYASPEIWKDQPYGSKSDIWSLGCVIFEMACLKPPFYGEDMEQLYKSISKGVFKRIPSTYSTELNDILRLMLQVDPLVRPSAQKLLNSSIMKTKIKETPELQSLILSNNQQLSYPQIIHEKLMKKKNIRQLSLHLPEANYNRARVKTLHERRILEEKSNYSEIFSKGSFDKNYSPSGRAKKSISRLPIKEQHPTGMRSKKSNYHNVSQKSTIIELARRQIMNIGDQKMRLIRQKMEKGPIINKNLEQIYMKKLINKRTKTDTDTLLKNISLIQGNSSERKVKF